MSSRRYISRNEIILFVVFMIKIQICHGIHQNDMQIPILKDWPRQQSRLGFKWTPPRSAFVLMTHPLSSSRTKMHDVCQTPLIVRVLHKFSGSTVYFSRDSFTIHTQTWIFESPAAGRTCCAVIACAQITAQSLQSLPPNPATLELP